MISYPMAVITAPGKVEFQERRFSGYSPEEVLVQVKAAAICGSDLHLFKGKHPAVPLPAAAGHEISGEVIATGSAVTRIKIGDRVTVEPVITCGTCEFCRRGLYHLCTRISFQYRKGQGGFAPYFIVHQDRAFKIPEHLSYEEGALVEPLAVALHAVKKSGLRVGQSSAIFGAGAIGLLALMLVKNVGGGCCFITDVNAFRLKKALDLGVDRAIDNRSEEAVQAILEETDQMGVDVSFEAVGLEMTLIQALKVLKKGGVATLLGIFEDPAASLPVNLFVQREITLSGSQGYNWDFQDGLALLERKSIHLDSLITHRIPLDRLQEGFEILTSPGCQAIKMIVQVGE